MTGYRESRLEVEVPYVSGRKVRTQGLESGTVRLIERPTKSAFVAELASGGRRLVEFSIELANTPGDLAKVATVLSKHKVHVLTGFHDPDKWSFFADVTEVESSVNDIVEELSSLAPVSKVSLREGLAEGIIVDTLHQQLMWGPFRTILIRAEVMSSMFDRVRGIFGAEGKAGRTLLYSMGEAAGRNFHKGIASQIGSETVRSHLKDIIALHKAQGWGDFKLISVDLEKATALARAHDNFECAPFEGTRSSPQSDFVRGHLAGIFSEVFSRKVEVTETLCVARGDAYCQFEAREVER
jgi:predicted hydrocarbon binding protein